ncbi:hypothetical protein SLEP1_g8059 [Rubroshorea leprosula]|uniref:Calcium uniporter protein C-terminal domain-containing protein n=1 Tax=Rubroshorea leprosula TaxID=152421 RepID=A0AAV5I8S4_9ROSI|nr:hypothetical protein SLEP1_g8059 [Rubroshorea leprosula]
MAWKKTLAERLFNISKIASPQSLTKCRVSSSPAVQGRIQQKVGKAATAIAPDPGDNGNGIFRRFLHKRAVFSPEIRQMPVGDNLIEKFRGVGIAKDRIRLDGLTPHLPPRSAEDRSSEVVGLTVDDARKLLRVAQLEVVKTRLRETGKTWIAYPEYVIICKEGCLDPDEGLRLARLLDECGTVIILGNVVVLRPDQVAKVIGGLIPLPGATNPSDPRRKELEQLEKQKSAIDEKADTLVRRELWGGLAYLVVQTAAFMRLTFWELSWDVMEPICFYVTSIYFMAGYAFFLRTAKEPSFEGFYQSRFSAKQKKLMKTQNFDFQRYNELRSLFYPDSLEQTSYSSFDQPETMQIGAADQAYR